MPTTTTWKAYGSAVTFAPAATLANAAGYLTAAQGADGTGGDLYDDLELATGFAVAPTVGTTIDLYLLPAPDGTNYPVGGTAQLAQGQLYVGKFEVMLSQTGSQTLVCRGVLLPPGLFKYLLWNTTGQTMASGWTLVRRPYDILST